MSDQEIDLSGDGGVMKKLLQTGAGTEKPLDGCIVSMHYTGKLVDGTVFDSSVGREPFEVVMGSASVIKAFELGIASMTKGEKCVITCAPEYAYGERGSPPSIPPNATLLFELEMLGWKGEDISPNKDGSIERFIVTKSNKRKTPNESAHVKVHLVGKYEDKIFEERDVEFDIGEGCDQGIVEGIEIALLKISVEETSRLIIKSKYAFGPNGNDQFNIPTNATVEYSVTLNECEMALEEWKLDKDESLAQAKIFKEKGTNYLKQEKYQVAIKMYKKSNNFLSSCNNEESQKLVVAIHLNIALSYQKLGDHFEAITACNRSLEIEPKNVKALYRRGQSLFAVSDYSQALINFKKVNEVDPSNKAAINQITICRQKINEYHAKEKEVYANMFTKFAAADKQKENSDREAEPDVLSSCGEWTEKDDKAFEKTFNVHMIDSNDVK